MLDTLILVHIDEVDREIKMVSIPRDLYYNGRKINAFAYFYGMPELVRVLGEISGYKIDKYILIDMYAFIDLVDLVGGIDIHLDSAVIDPTYKTIDNGVEGTLHYEPGDYHLGGKEALRLARSRHTSSDFARSERQQMILSALQDKARGFGFGDADTIYEIAKVVLAQTETDIEINEAISYYFKYQNYEINGSGGLSTGNVLELPKYVEKKTCEEGYDGLDEEGKKACDEEKFAYTLVPQNDDWDLIKWYIRGIFE